MAQRDYQLARIAMGAVNIGRSPGMPDASSSPPGFEVGRAPGPIVTGVPGGGGVGRPPGGGGGSTTRASLTAGRLSASKVGVTRASTPRPTRPMAPPPPPVDVVDPPTTRPQPFPLPSSSSGGGGGSYPTPSRPDPIDESPALPDVIQPSSGGGVNVSGQQQLAIGAGLLLGAYFLLKKA